MAASTAVRAHPALTPNGPASIQHPPIERGGGQRGVAVFLDVPSGAPFPDTAELMVLAGTLHGLAQDLLPGATARTEVRLDGPPWDAAVLEAADAAPDRLSRRPERPAASTRAGGRPARS